MPPKDPGSNGTDFELERLKFEFLRWKFEFPTWIYDYAYVILHTSISFFYFCNYWVTYNTCKYSSLWWDIGVLVYLTWQEHCMYQCSNGIIIKCTREKYMYLFIFFAVIHVIVIEIWKKYTPQTGQKEYKCIFTIQCNLIWWQKNNSVDLPLKLYTRTVDTLFK